MMAFLESPVGQLIGRNGILAIILAWALYDNHNLVERLFVVVNNNNAALNGVMTMCKEVVNGRE